MFHLNNLNSFPYVPKITWDCINGWLKYRRGDNSAQTCKSYNKWGQLWYVSVQGSQDLQCIIDNLITPLKAKADIVIISTFSWRALALPGYWSQEEINQRVKQHM